jgi:hypothetical protein
MRNTPRPSALVTSRPSRGPISARLPTVGPLGSLVATSKRGTTVKAAGEFLQADHRGTQVLAGAKSSSDSERGAFRAIHGRCGHAQCAAPAVGIAACGDGSPQSRVLRLRLAVTSAALAPTRTQRESRAERREHGRPVVTRTRGAGWSSHEPPLGQPAAVGELMRLPFLASRSTPTQCSSARVPESLPSVGDTPRSHPREMSPRSSAHRLTRRWQTPRTP